ncbi:MAG: hypothetical protein IGBAC_0663 [Ignavibacteriae bacterium]|nr:MAG: hypothetical protein IGBAC_0663 [Ignavibacteriota bacterium]
MKCNKKYLIPDFIQNKLSPLDAETLKGHMEQCKTCTDEYKNLKKIFNKLAAEKHTEPDEIYWINLLPNIHKRINMGNFDFYIKYVPQIIVSAAILLIVSLLMIKLYDNFEYDQNIQENAEIVALIDSSYQDLLYDYGSDSVSDNYNSLDKFVLKNIILTSNNIEELYKEEISISELKEEEVNELLTYLSEEKIYKR